MAALVWRRALAGEPALAAEPGRSQVALIRTR